MVTSYRVRAAAAADVEAIVVLAAQRREQYRAYQPTFWRPAEDAAAKHRDFFLTLLGDDQVTVVVAVDDRDDVRGFVVARTVAAPPVYDPGGLTCLVDDFTVADDADWPAAGPLLIDAVTRWSAGRGATQLVVVTAHLDAVKRQTLQDAGLALASEWWTGGVPDIR